MTIVLKCLLLALMTLVIRGGVSPAHGAIIVKDNADLIERSVVLGEPGLSRGTPDRMENTPELAMTAEPMARITHEEAVVSEFVPMVSALDKPVSNSVPSTAHAAARSTDMPGQPQPGFEPYVMLLVGLGMIVVAIILHLKSVQHGHSGFKPPQDMPFV